MRRLPLFAGLLAAGLLAAACGDDATDEAAASATTQPAVVADEPVEDTDEAATPDEAPADEQPARDAPSTIISLSPTATEMLYAIGAGDQVLAVDDFSNYPPEAAAKMQGLSGFEPNVEAIAGLEPDLVVTDGTNPDLLGQLDTLGIDRWEGPAASTFDDVYDQIEQLGAATGRADEAAELVGQMQSEVDAVIAGLPALDEPLTYYHELDSTFFTVSSETFIGAVYDEMGLVNIVDLSGEDLGFYPQLSAEFVIDSNPDLIFLACTKYCGETADTVAERPGWDAIDALANGGVIEMDDDIASRWGPRIVDYLQAAGDAVGVVAEG
ncbi:MAG: ABC transporter substrate-binding protein [Ilumatobacter sp.]|uniref:ABC transporter substrate-binding protein n=1 Tax=Ilumatobacter sp. TaxID=1967498 RepID=UPI00262FFEE7|nr:ABC transporter substrate-binding protein [Ilumatobacter sp.]MDJ0767640.1 ABC transporter substrate-binding protein [Ilumatobacter sp.]